MLILYMLNRLMLEKKNHEQYTNNIHEEKKAQICFSFFLQVCSGLLKYMQTSDVSYEKDKRNHFFPLLIKLFQLDQKLVIVVCNLKPAKMRGITSEASKFKGIKSFN